MKYTITAEMIKAIRIVRGFKPDLRVKIKRANRDCMYDFIDGIFPDLFGLDVLGKKYDDGLLSDRYERAVWTCVNAVCDGSERNFSL